MTALRKIGGWYWSGLKRMPAFSAGYIVGGIAVAILMTLPKIAYATLAMVP